MLFYLQHSEVDKQKWDDCILKSPNFRTYAMSWYLDVVSPSWEAIVEDDYNAVFPLTSKKKYGISYLCQPHFTQQLGIFSKETDSQKFLNTIPDKFRYIDICINYENSKNIEMKNFPDYTARKNINCELNLDKKYNDIYRNYSENTKRNIKKAIKSGVEISTENISLSELIKIFKNNKGKEFSHLKSEYYTILSNLVKTLDRKNALKIYGAFDNEKKLCAGAVFFVFNNITTFLFSATNENSKNNRAMFLLIDNFIKTHSEKIPLLDFEGSNDTNLARFYKSFGAKETLYLQLGKNNLPKYLKWLKK